MNLLILKKEIEAKLQDIESLGDEATTEDMKEYDSLYNHYKRVCTMLEEKNNDLN